MIVLQSHGSVKKVRGIYSTISYFLFIAIQLIESNARIFAICLVAYHFPFAPHL